VEEVRARTLVLADSRGGDRFLRVTWHPATSTVVFSHWTGSICTASTPVSLAEASRVIELLVGALRGLVNEALTSHSRVQVEKTAVPDLLHRLRRGSVSISDLTRRLRAELNRRAAR
jgi:hypothetical protein